MAVKDETFMNELRRTGRFTESACTSETLSVYGITDVYWAGKTPFCDSVVIAENPTHGRMLFMDNEIQSAQHDEAIYHEHLVHPILNALTHIPEKRVLVIGGGEGATPREVLKWNVHDVAHVDWVDIDGELVKLCKQHMKYAPEHMYADKRLTYYAADARTFLKECVRYDVVILDLPDPDIEDILADPANALYGPGFWELLKPHGAIVSHAGPVIPGGRDTERRAGLAHIQKMAQEHGFGSGASYHVTIPSFQNVWGFWMSMQPSNHAEFPISCVVMDSVSQRQAFTWPCYWHALS
jgi:spermidine synthase